MTKDKRMALVKGYLGKLVDIKIDRPIGYIHKKEDYSLTYPINYGYIPSVLGGDGEELDVYLMGVSVPVTEYRCRIIGIVHRENDVEDKLVAAPFDRVFYQDDIAREVFFQERYYCTRIESLFERSAGAVVYSLVNGRIRYLLIKAQNGDIGFPKGHVELGESDEDAAVREIFEETSVKAELCGGFREYIEYVMPSGKTKRVIYFVARYDDQVPSHNEGFENNEYMLLEYKEARFALSFDNAKEILDKANDFISAQLQYKKG